MGPKKEAGQEPQPGDLPTRLQPTLQRQEAEASAGNQVMQVRTGQNGTHGPTEAKGSDQPCPWMQGTRAFPYCILHFSR